jgi:hypothetical protein
MLIIRDLENSKKYIKKKKRRFSRNGGLGPPKRIYQSLKKELSEKKIMGICIKGRKDLLIVGFNI